MTVAAISHPPFSNNSHVDCYLLFRSTGITRIEIALRVVSLVHSPSPTDVATGEYRLGEGRNPIVAIETQIRLSSTCPIRVSITTPADKGENPHQQSLWWPVNLIELELVEEALNG